MIQLDSNLFLTNAFVADLLRLRYAKCHFNDWTDEPCRKLNRRSRPITSEALSILYKVVAGFTNGAFPLAISTLACMPVSELHPFITLLHDSKILSVVLGP